MEKVTLRSLSHPEGTKRHRKRTKVTRKCNLCGSKFTTAGAHILFCSKCRANNEVIRFSEWLPEVAPEEYAEGDVNFDFEKAA